MFGVQRRCSRYTFARCSCRHTIAAGSVVHGHRGQSIYCRLASAAGLLAGTWGTHSGMS